MTMIVKILIGSVLVTDFDLELHRLWTSNNPEIQNGRIWKYSLTPKRLEDV